MSPLKITDVFCYICRGILIEPVTLPCFHVFCFSCFEQSMQETSYSCPLCRKRISNWVRSVKKSNNLVNVKLWTQIKEQYKEQVHLKLNGEDDGLDQRIQRECSVYASTSKPGEVAQEFSKLLNEFRSERERLKQAEELASKEYIMKLKEEEERQLQLLQEDNIMRIKQDSDLAMKIQEEINKEISSPSQSEINTKTEKRVKKTNRKNVDKPLKGPMDDFLKNCEDSENTKEQIYSEDTKDERSTSTDSTDSIRLEMNLFKPIKKVRRTPPKLYPDGRIREISLTKVTPLKLTFSNLGPSSSSTSIIEGIKIHSSHSAFVDTNSVAQETRDNYESPSKRLRIASDLSEGGVLKDITLEENADSNSSTIAQDDSIKKKSNSARKSAQENFSLPYKIPKYDLESRIQERTEDENDTFETQDYIDPDPSIEDKIIEEQLRIEKMILQEKEDRILALKLSREWESELIKKPQTRSMQAAATKSTKTVTGKKSQQTLMESIANRTRNRKK